METPKRSGWKIPDRGRDVMSFYVSHRVKDRNPLHQLRILSLYRKHRCLDLGQCQASQLIRKRQDREIRSS